MAFSNQLRNMAGALVMLFLAIGLNHGSACEIYAVIQTSDETEGKTDDQYSC